jgi:hypothetical protein
VEKFAEIASEAVVFVEDSLGGMIGGVALSATREGEFGTVSGKGGKQAMGRLQPRAGFGPRGLLFFLLFSLFFLFSFVKISKKHQNDLKKKKIVKE